MSRMVITNIGYLATPEGFGPRAGEEQGKIKLLQNAYIVCEDGKITAKQVEDLVVEHRNDGAFEHIAQPKLVYISDSTELGTIYTRKELEEISAV